MTLTVTIKNTASLQEALAALYCKANALGCLGLQATMHSHIETATPIFPSQACALQGKACSGSVTYQSYMCGGLTMSGFFCCSNRCALKVQPAALSLVLGGPVLWPYAQMCIPPVLMCLASRQKYNVSVATYSQTFSTGSAIEGNELRHNRLLLGSSSLEHHPISAAMTLHQAHATPCCCALAAEAEDEAPKEPEAEAEAAEAAAEAAVAAMAAPVTPRHDYSKQHLEYIASSRNQVQHLYHCSCKWAQQHAMQMSDQPVRVLDFICTEMGGDGRAF